MVRKQYKPNDEITSNNICIVSYNLQPYSSPWSHFILTKILQIVNILCPHFTNERLSLILVCWWMFKDQLSGKKKFKALSYSVCPFPWCKHSNMSFSSYQRVTECGVRRRYEQTLGSHKPVQAGSSPALGSEEGEDWSKVTQMVDSRPHLLSSLLQSKAITSHPKALI